MLSKAQEPQSYGKSTLVSKETSFTNNFKDYLSQFISNWPVDFLHKLLPVLGYIDIKSHNSKRKSCRKIYQYSSFFLQNIWMQCNNFLQPVIAYGYVSIFHIHYHWSSTINHSACKILWNYPQAPRIKRCLFMQKGDDSSLLGVENMFPSTNMASITHHLHVHTHTHTLTLF